MVDRKYTLPFRSIRFHLKIDDIRILSRLKIPYAVDNACAGIIIIEINGKLPFLTIVR